jgi:nucleoside-diphosphate kinase
VKKRTLAIIKPDAVANGKTGEIIARIQQAGFTILAMKLTRMSVASARGFYEVHKERPFYDDLVAFMTSGPCAPMALEKENAVADYRKLIGATDPAEAEDGTIRKDFAESKSKNAVHGSDSDENAAIEIAHFFTRDELLANER